MSCIIIIIVSTLLDQMEHKTNEDFQNEPSRKKIIIIGSGVSGLSLLSALLHLQKTVPQLNIEPILYTKSTPEEFTKENGNAASEMGEKYNQRSVHYNQTHNVLWKGGLKASLELGIAGRLGRAGWPVVEISSLDVGGNPPDTLVDWSTSNATHGILDIDPDNLPPMIALKHIDVVRALLTRIAGHPELVQGSSRQDFKFKPSNNSPLSPNAPSLPSNSMEADLAEGDWYHNQGFSELIPCIKFSHELESFVISAENGTVYLKFTNGLRDKAFMLIGADGADSTVRSLLLSSRCPLQFAKQLCIKGITTTLAPPISSPTNVPNSSIPINILSRSQLFDVVKDGESKSWIIGSTKIGAVNMGNERIGWTLIVHQETPGEYADKFSLSNRRRELGLSLGGGNVGNVTPIIAVVAKEQIVNQDSASSWQEWKAPSSEERAFSSQDSSSLEQLSLKNKTLASVESFSRITPAADSSLNPSLLSTSDLNGYEARDLALHLLSQVSSSQTGSPIPSFLFSIISQTDTFTTVAFDNVDLHGENVPSAYTSPKFHPGRVILVGDAAHAMTEDVHGSHSLGFCLADAVVLSKLIGFYLSPDGANYYSRILAGQNTSANSPDEIVEGDMSLEMHLLAKIALDYSAMRVGVGSQAVSDSFSQSSWYPSAPDTSSIWKSLTRFAGLRRESWALGDASQNQFKVETERGKPDMPSGTDIIWPNLCSY